MKRFAPILLLVMLLSACTPGTIETGPYRGCELTWDAQINCDYRDLLSPREEPPTVAPTPPGLPPIVEEPPHEPEEPETPDTPEEPEEPGTPEEPTDPGSPPEEEDCKPGWGWGDKKHCHDGPPGRRK